MLIFTLYATQFKLMLRTGLLSLSSRFSGLRSLCAMFRWWHFCIASAIWNIRSTLNRLSLLRHPPSQKNYKLSQSTHVARTCLVYRAAFFSVKPLDLLILSKSSPPCMYSMTRSNRALRDKTTHLHKLLTQTFTWLTLFNTVTVKLPGFPGRVFFVGGGV